MAPSIGVVIQINVYTLEKNFNFKILKKKKEFFVIREKQKIVKKNHHFDTLMQFFKIINALGLKNKKYKIMYNVYNA